MKQVEGKTRALLGYNTNSPVSFQSWALVSRQEKRTLFADERGLGGKELGNLWSGKNFITFGHRPKWKH